MLKEKIENHIKENAKRKRLPGIRKTVSVFMAASYSSSSDEGAFHVRKERCGSPLPAKWSPFSSPPLLDGYGHDWGPPTRRARNEAVVFMVLASE
ncbi:hypothetical protein L345_15940, partial [Ophiophagus hannah]